MIWKIAKKEFLLNLMTFKFTVGAVACVLLTVVFIPILAADYRQRLEMYNKNVADKEAELRKVVVYRSIRYTIYRPPAVLSAFSAGLEKQLAGSAQIELEKVPELSVTQRSGNPYLPILTVFDQSLIFKIVISILALLVAYDTVSGEREQGTLKLMLSDPIARHQVLLGKLVAGLITLSVPVTITFVVGLVVLLSYLMVALSGSDWIRIGLMYLASLAFTAVMYQFGLLFSSLARRSAISMVLGLFIWIIFAIVIPNASVQLATQLRPLESQDKRNSRMEALKKDLARSLSYVSPISTYEDVMAVLAGTDLTSFQDFIDQVRAHRNEVVEYIRSKTDNFSSPSFFAVCSEAESAEYTKLYVQVEEAKDEQAKTKAKQALKEWEQNNPVKAVPLDLRDFPWFKYRPNSAAALRKAIPDLAGLLIMNVVLFGMCFAAFARYDVR